MFARKKVIINHDKLLIMRKVILLCIGILCLSSCSKLRGRVEPKPNWFKYYSAFNNNHYQEFFQQKMEEFMNDSMLCAKPYLSYFYQDTPTPIWTANGFQQHKVDALLEHIEHAYEHGIPSSHFGYDTLMGLITQLQEHKIANDTNIYSVLFGLENSLSEVYAKYAKALQYGATDPKVVNGGKWLYEMTAPDSTFYQSLASGIPDISETLASMQPTDTLYRQLQEELKRLYPIRDTALKEIPVRSVKVGQSGSNIPLVCQRLRITGELPANYPDTTLLTQEVLKGINKFRLINNIPTGDSLGKETIEKLNRPISYYVDKLSANMERLRWKTKHAKGESYIAVNIPDFTLQTFVDNKRVFKTKICCGKTQNPKNNPARVRNGITRAHKAETPLLHSEIRRIVLNPEWNIPYDIVKNEYYPKLCKSNTAVINREHLLIKDTRTGKYVAPETIDWTKVNRNNIPYRLFQSSGRYNALGQVKFDFANTESVYLHDTNNKGAFKRRVRTLSHGCVRVENPMELAHILYEYNNYDEWEIERLGILVGEKPQTKKGEKYLEKMEEKEQEYYEKLPDSEKPFYRKLRPSSVMLKNKMPLFIEYYTCFIGDNGQIHYREDVYYKDDNILNKLK